MIGRCHICNEQANFIKANDKLRCDRCFKKSKDIWACDKLPNAHAFCQRCHEVALV